MDANLNWKAWHGGEWAGDPEQLVFVRFGDGEDNTDGGPVPARVPGICWRHGFFGRRDLQVEAYALPEAAER